VIAEHPGTPTGADDQRNYGIASPPSAIDASTGHRVTVTFFPPAIRRSRTGIAGDEPDRHPAGLPSWPPTAER
jgi:hypothetical protein